MPKLLPRLLLHVGSDAVMTMLLALCVGEPPALEPGMPPQPPQPNPSGSWIPYADNILSLTPNPNPNPNPAPNPNPHPNPNPKPNPST